MATNHFVPFALAPAADRYNTSPSTDWVRVPGSGKLQFLLVEGAGGTGTATITVNSASDNAGTGATAIPFRYKTATSSAELNDAGGYTTATASGVTPAAGANKSTLVEVRFDEVSAGKPYVSLTLTEVANFPVDAGVIAIIKDGDRPGDPNVTYLS